MEESIKHLQAIIQTKTISYLDRSRIDFVEYEKFIDHLKEFYPTLFKKAEFKRVETYSLLFKLKGKTDKNPVGLMGHYDVVPVNNEGWIVDPFSAEIKDDFIYGRGTLDMKGHVVALLEAIESLLLQGQVFERDIYLMFGHNEETGSALPDSGAKKVMEVLKDEGVHFHCVIDEGGAYIEGTPMGVDGVVGLIGVAEKGYCDIELSAIQKGGHASMPPKTSALYEVCKAALSMESNKFDADYNDATNAMFDALLPFMNQPLKLLFSYRNLFKPILIRALTKSPETAATVRTTSVMTMASGSKAPNVLAQEAKVMINCRLVPGDTVKKLVERIQKRVGPSITVTPNNGNDPTIISPSNNEQFKTIVQSMKTIYPDIITVAPYLMVAATDSRIYHPISDGVYRVQPFMSMLKDRSTVHADNERISIESYLKGIDFFKLCVTQLSNQ